MKSTKIQRKRISAPKKYIPDKLTRKERLVQEKELAMSRKQYKNGKYYTRKKASSYTPKKSNHIRNAEQTYNVTIIPNNSLSKKTGCSLKALNAIVKKGQGAYYSSGSRPNQTAHSWGYARLASAITGGKAAAVDFNIIKNGCKKNGTAYRLARVAQKKHKRGTRKVPRYKRH